VEAFFGHKDLGAMAEVEIEVCGLDECDHPVLQLWGKGMRGLSAFVPMEYAKGTLLAYAFFSRSTWRLDRPNISAACLAVIFSSSVDRMMSNRLHCFMVNVTSPFTGASPQPWCPFLHQFTQGGDIIHLLTQKKK